MHLTHSKVADISLLKYAINDCEAYELLIGILSRIEVEKKK